MLKLYGLISKSVITFVVLLMTAVAAHANTASSGNLLHRAQNALTQVIIHDIFSPPVASRIYAYANIAAYESIAVAGNEYKSLAHSIAGFPVIERTDNAAIDPDVVSLLCFFRVAKHFVFSEQMLVDSLTEIVKSISHVSPSSFQKSSRLAERVADSIILWAARDNYGTTRKMRRYTHSKETGKWLPTPPGYISAIEPHWARMRTIVLDSCSQFKPAPPPPFSTDSTSAFFREAMHVYRTVQNLTSQEKDIANFWDCNPFYINTQGHLNFATKKMSPGAHWILIAGQASRKKNFNTAQTAAAYMLTSVAIYDGFISCWDEKYRSNVIRPESYINSYVDEEWRPILQTPPFPEYTSGHSVVSAASAVVLTKLFGENFVFADSSEMNYGIPPRTFRSFVHASEEAAISRLYGGIHYNSAIQAGQRQGALIGKKVIEKIRLK